MDSTLYNPPILPKMLTKKYCREIFGTVDTVRFRDLDEELLNSYPDLAGHPAMIGRIADDKLTRFTRRMLWRSDIQGDEALMEAVSRWVKTKPAIRKTPYVTIYKTSAVGPTCDSLFTTHL